MENARLDRQLTTLWGATLRWPPTSAGRRAGLVPTETPASCRAMRHNGRMEPDHAARAYGYESVDDWSDAVAAEMRWGVFDPTRLHQLDDLFADARVPVSPEGAGLLRAWKDAAPPDGDLDPLYAGGWVDDNGRLTGHAIRLMFDSLAAMEQASR